MLDPETILRRRLLFASLRTLPYPLLRRCLTAWRKRDLRSSAFDEAVRSHGQRLDAFLNGTTIDLGLEGGVEAFVTRYQRYLFCENDVQLACLLLKARSDRFLRTRVVSPDLPVLERCLSTGRGAVIASAHLGMQIGLAAILAARGHRVLATGEDLLVRMLEPFRSHLRCGNRITAQRTDQPTILVSARRALLQGDLVWMMADFPLQPRTRVVDVPFLGGRLGAAYGAAALASAAGVPVIPMAMVSDRSGFRVLAGEPVQPSGEESPKRVAATLVATFERWIKAYPNQWVGLEFLPRYWRMEPEVALA